MRGLRPDPAAITALAGDGATGAGTITTAVIDELADALEPGDIVIDGGNSYHRDDIDRAAGWRCVVSGCWTAEPAVGCGAWTVGTP